MGSVGTGVEFHGKSMGFCRWKSARDASRDLCPRIISNDAVSSHVAWAASGAHVSAGATILFQSTVAGVAVPAAAAPGTDARAAVRADAIYQCSRSFQRDCVL